MRASSGKRLRALRRGFTMIEVMVAILLTAIAIVGILALYMTQTNAASYSRHSSEATMLAADGLETLRTMATPVSATESNLTETGASGGIFTRVSTVGGSPALYTLQVSVSWTEAGATRTVTVWGKR